MQSGISASKDLHDAFNTFVSFSNDRILLASIQNEQLVPVTTIPSTSSDFKSDLSALQPHINSTTALYILLKLSPAPDGYAAITYVPNAAPVRQKMLFASTRLTLVRELGIERFRETLFATEAQELTAEGWEKHEKHGELEAPLTEEEAGLKGVKEAEISESGGTGTRRGHVSRGVEVKTGEGVLEALGSLREEGCRGTLVQLKFALPEEVLVLESSVDGVAVGKVAETISKSEPRFSFYSTEQEGEIVFIYTCPTQSRIKERMVYSTSKSWTRIVAERDAGLVVKKSVEATEPAEITEMLGGSAAEDKAEETKPSNAAFARPKRPGRR